ncbi:MAG: radical SAM protein [Chloroflexota bacterium]
MRVLLIAPKSKLPIDVRTTPSLGLAYIGAVSEQRGDQVRLLDMNVDDTPLAQALEPTPAIVGLTANTSQIKAAWWTAQEIKALRDVPVVLGGPHPTVLPQESLEKPFVDIVVRGEGEATWRELCELLEGRGGSQWKQDLASVPGLSFQNGGVVVHNPDRPLITDLDDLPFPSYHLFQIDRYTSLQPAIDNPQENTPSYSIMTSRGCPYRCHYCSQSIFPARWRARSPENVLAEWRWLVEEMGAREIGVLDDSFNIDRKRVRAICDGLITAGLNRVPWILINGIRANLADEESLAQMKRAGLKRTAFGVESGDQVILNSIDKHLKLEEVEAAFKAARRVGLETIGFFMIGLPGETEATMDETIKLACKLDPVVANFSMTTPFPGTVLYEQVKANGRFLMDDWDDFVFFEGKARYEMGSLTAELQERKWREAYRRFYLRPHRLWRTLARKDTWLNLPRVLRMGARLVLPKGWLEAGRRDMELKGEPCN